MGLIKLGIGSALHQLMKCLVMLLPAAMGKINSSCLDNSTNLIKMIKHMSMTRKKTDSFDVRASEELVE